jgi:uncharacterized protein
MKIKQSAIYTIFLIIGICFLSLNISAGNAAEINARMKARLPEIVSLKKAGIIGENNKGYLEYIGSDRQKENIVNAENNDRKIIYKLIAIQQKTTKSYVGKLRANQIAKKADKGYWIQKSNGEWYKK